MKLEKAHSLPSRRKTSLLPMKSTGILAIWKMLLDTASKETERGNAWQMETIQLTSLHIKMKEINYDVKPYKKKQQRSKCPILP